MKPVTLVNCTPHNIHLVNRDGAIRIIMPSGHVARCEEKRLQVHVLDVGGLSIPINNVGYGDLEGLPPPAPDTYYIVSALAARAAASAGRDDVLVVDDPLRDSDGRIYAARALARIW